MERLDESKLGIARFWRNPPVRRVAWWFGAALVSQLLLVWAFTSYATERLKAGWLDDQTVLLGQVAALDPGVARQLPRLLVEEPTEEQREAGRRLAESYGLAAYVRDVPPPFVASFAGGFRRLLLAGGAGVLLLLFWGMLREQRRQLTAMRDLALSLEMAVKRNVPMPFRPHEEGEFGLLADAVTELSRRLQETIARLQREKVFLKDTIANISHQLKTPLASLTVFVDLLREGRTGPAETQEFLETCRKELDRMEWLVLTLLKIARLEAGALELQRAAKPLAETVEQALASVRALAEARNVRLDIETRDSELAFSHDSRWLAEAIANVVKNAVEHSPPGERVTIAWERTPVFVRLRVTDRGSGIDEAHLPHIFKKFYRASRSGSGAGLGLALAKSIVERHGGMISAESRPAGGTVFTMTFPLQPNLSNL